MKDIKGIRFGRLVAIEAIGVDKNHKMMWRCMCDCGNTAVVNGCSLRNGDTRSCGCLHRETSSQNGRESRACVTKHGGSREKLYFVWRSMRNRCERKENPRYKDWGGRGISVCEEWDNSFLKFKQWAMENGYNPNARRGECTIDRINNDGDYCPQNCRWTTAKVQAGNRERRRIGGAS